MPNMVKSELIQKVSQHINSVPVADIELCVKEILDYLSLALTSGERIEIRGFGSFSLRYRPPRKAHNPKTGEKVATIGKYSPHFKAGKELRQRVNDLFLLKLITD